MSEEIQDPGLGLKFERVANRSINKDGSFNVKRVNFGYHFKNTYQSLIRMNWFLFFVVVTVFILGSNLLFAGAYFLAGRAELSGLFSHNEWDHFLQCVYFSFQSFTTVGFGSISPVGHFSSIVSSIESVYGLISFAFITGLLYGRFSRPQAMFKYSKNALIAPYKDGKSLQFRFVNRRSSQIIELSADVMLSYNKKIGGSYARKFSRLQLEIDSILFLPLNWTLVHPIDEKSPLYSLTQEELVEGGAEIMILIKGFDDTFSQIVHSRYSYTFDEVVWDAKFVKPYHVDENGEMVLDKDLVDEYEKV
ncbi:ion channel [Reichenbachiella ulvae]|uniref:Ion channel n=1 Tax=Reichenbachiella ulvae TaxID=2980104 RepID=A0ABT3CY69_9BACT|nr:ion channel [Reichenbachiella ulvae]MCV9388153.1 ion channel [Reichenbachiella ulvae]